MQESKLSLISQESQTHIFYESVFVVKQETISIGRVRWLSSFAVWYSRTPLCFPPKLDCSSTDREWRALPGKIAPPPQLRGQNLEMNVSIQWDFSTALWCRTNHISLNLILTDELAAGPTITSIQLHVKSISGFTSVTMLSAQLPKIARLLHNKAMQSGCSLSARQRKQFDKNHLTHSCAYKWLWNGRKYLACFCSCHIFQMKVQEKPLQA